MICVVSGRGGSLFLQAEDGIRDIGVTGVQTCALPILGAELAAAAAADPRVSVSLGFLADDDLVAEVTAAELVVLPYREMHNSGGTLAALSLDRPVLVPDNPVNEQLAAEVGPGWVHRYAGELTAGHLVDAVTALRAAPPAAPPDLSGRDWDRVGEAHAAAYRQ